MAGKQVPALQSLSFILAHFSTLRIFASVKFDISAIQYLNAGGSAKLGIESHHDFQKVVR